MVDRAICHSKALSTAISPAVTIQMMVDMVGIRDGEFTRKALCDYLGLTEAPTPSHSEEHWRTLRQAQGDPVINAAIKLMADHLEDTLTVGQIADLLGVSARKLERGFNDYLKQSPLKVYRDLRLDRARQLLAQTSLSMSEISVACGFSNVTLMKKWFIQKYGQYPMDVRKHAFGVVNAA